MTDLVTSFLANLEAQYASQLQSTINEVATASVDATRRRTVAARKKEWATAVASLDLETLTKVETMMTEYVDKIVTIETTDPRELEHSEAVSLMAEHDRMRDITEFLDTRREAIKTLVFAHLDKTVGPGENGALKIPEMRRVFKREGAGQPDPQLNIEELVRLLGPEANRVFDVVDVPEVVVPAHTETVFSEEKLMRLIQEDPSKMELLKKAIVPGKPKTPRFVPRDYDPEDDTKKKG